MLAGDLVVDANSSLFLSSEPWTVGIGIVIGFAGSMVRVEWGGETEVLHNEDELRKVKLEAV